MFHTHLARVGSRQRPMHCALHLYVPDTDAVYRRAIEELSEEEMERREASAGKSA